MSDRIGIRWIVIINDHVFVRQRPKRQRLDKLRRVPRHRHPDLAARLLQQPHHLNSLIRRDPAANTQTYAKLRHTTILQPKLPQMMIDVFELRLAPLFTGERAEKAMDVAVGAGFSEAMKFSYQRG